MAAELEKTGSELADDPTLQRSQAPMSPPMSRRALLRGVAVTLPTVLTLHSGAALAMSSNVIRQAVGAPKDPNGNYLCLDVSSTYGETRKRGVYDLGSPPHAEVTAIPSETPFYAEPKDGSRQVTGPEMCDRGGTYYYKEADSRRGFYGGYRRRKFDGWGDKSGGGFGGGHDGWIQGEVPRGVMCSATAMASFAAKGAIDIREI